jgi:hypothetical protein
MWSRNKESIEVTSPTNFLSSRCMLCFHANNKTRCWCKGNHVVEAEDAKCGSGVYAETGKVQVDVMNVIASTREPVFVGTD